MGQARLGQDGNALPNLARRGLPTEVSHAVAGLAPLVGQVAASALSARNAARLLEVVREALVEDAVTRAMQARGRNAEAGTSTADQGLRTDLRRWWDGLEGVLTAAPVPLGEPRLQRAAESWAQTIRDSRRQRDGGLVRAGAALRNRPGDPTGRRLRGGRGRTARGSGGARAGR